MTSIRVAIATALAVGALIAGGTHAQQITSAGGVITPAGPVTCCH